MDDCISRQEAIDALWKALYEYEDKTEKQFQESDELDVSEWIVHRIFVQNMSDIDRRIIRNLPSAQPKAGHWIEHEWAEEANGMLISNYECSECHRWERYNSDFCPNCGTRMEE